MTTNIAVDRSGRLAPAARPIVHRTHGRRRGMLTHFLNPANGGDLIKPFVALDLFESDPIEGNGFAPHPHSGIATHTTFLEGIATYADSTGKSGTLSAGSIEWMQAGRGVWHGGEMAPGEPIRGYQLWIALPAELELAPAESLYLEPDRIPGEGPIRVLLGSYGGLASPIHLPVPISYLHVRLKDGQQWTYAPAAGHDLAWLALNRGRLRYDDAPIDRELVIFGEGNDPIALIAEGDVEFVIGSAAKHPHALVCGSYSIHTSARALAEGQREIVELGHSAAVRALGRA